MSTAAITAVFRHSASKGSARLVLLAMADEAHSNGELTAYRRSQSWLAGKANVDGGTVRRAIAQLVELGEVELLNRGDGRASSDYRLLLPGLDIEGVQDAPPAHADGTPSTGEVRAQGVQDAPPIIPLFPVQNPVLPTDTCVADFDAFWSAYPKSADKGAARKAWATARRKADPNAIVAGAERYRDDPNRMAHFTKNAATWLNAEAWDNPPLPARPGGPRAPGGPRFGPEADDEARRAAPSGRVEL